MKILQKFHILLPLFASLIIGTVSYLQKDSLETMATKLIITITAFYLLGSIARHLVQNILLENALDVDLQMSRFIEDVEDVEQNVTAVAEEIAQEESLPTAK